MEHNIEKLLSKYLNAETSLTEEKVLQTYFMSEKVAPHLKVYQPLFDYFKQNKKIVFSKEINLPLRKKRRKVLFIAASVTLLVGLFFSANQYYKQQQAEKQYLQVKNVLQLVAANLSTSKQAVANLYTYENTVNKIFNLK